MDYNECLVLINSIEARDTEVRTVVADVYELGPQINFKVYEAKGASALIDMLTRMEGSSTTRQKAPAPSAAPRPQQAPAAPQQRRSLFRGTAARSQGQKVTAAKELESALASKEKFAPAPQKEEDALVMPTLSLQDQISELEKISMGLDGNVFDSSQLDIVKREVIGVRKTTMFPTDEFQKNLLEIRNARLKEVSTKLGI